MSTLDPIVTYLAYFFIYAFTGWCVEVAYHAITNGHFVNRGMLVGPVCPIYGLGMMIMIAALSPVQNNLPLLFVAATIICSLLELVVGGVLRWFFHAQWWDYSKEKFNIAGLVCLRFSLAWGVGGAFLIKVVHPLTDDAVALLPPFLLAILVLAASIVICADIGITLAGLLKLRKRYDALSDLEAQIRKASTRIGLNVTELTLDAASRLQPIGDGLEALRQDTQAELAERRGSLEARLHDQADAAALKKLEAQKRLEALLDHYHALQMKAPRLDKRLKKAFPDMKWFERK